MPKGWRDWDVVVRALIRVGCDKYDEDEDFVYVTKFPHKGQAIRKWLVAKEVERHLLAKLHVDAALYQDAIREIEAEDRGEPPKPPSVPSGDPAHALALAKCLADVRRIIEDGGEAGAVELSVEIDAHGHIDVVALVREATERRDDLRLALEHQVHAVMRRHEALVWVTVCVPSVPEFRIGRPGYDD